MYVSECMKEEGDQGRSQLTDQISNVILIKPDQTVSEINIGIPSNQRESIETVRHEFA